MHACDVCGGAFVPWYKYEDQRQLTPQRLQRKHLGAGKLAAPPLFLLMDTQLSYSSTNTSTGTTYVTTTAFRELETGILQFHYNLMQSVEHAVHCCPKVCYMIDHLHYYINAVTAVPHSQISFIFFSFLAYAHVSLGHCLFFCYDSLFFYFNHRIYLSL